MQLADLLKLADGYCAHVGRSEATISNQITSHARLFKRLRQGHGCTVQTFGAAVAWFDQNWPQDLEWPRQVVRPSKTDKQGAA